MRIGTRAAHSRWCRRTGSRPGSVRRRAGRDRRSSHGDRGAALGDKSRWVSELERALVEAGSTSPCTRRRTSRPSSQPGLELVAFPPRADPRDAMCGAPSLRSGRARGWDEQPAPRRAAAGGAARSRSLRASRQRRHATAQTGRRGGRRARARARRDWNGSDARTRPAASSTSSCRPPARARWRSRRVPARSTPRCACCARPDARRASAPSATLVRALGASCNTPVGANAGRRRRRAELTAWVGLPDGRPGWPTS